MPGTAWRASAIPFPGGPAPTGNGRQRRPGKRHGRRMLCGKTPGERTRRSSSRLRAGERFFWQRLHGTPAAWGGRPLNASARAGRLFTVASEERFFFGSACMAGRRIGPAARLTTRTGWDASSRLRAGGTHLMAAPAWQAGESGRLPVRRVQTGETAAPLWTDRAKTGILALSL